MSASKWTFNLVEGSGKHVGRSAKLNPPGFSEASDSLRPSKKDKNAEDQVERETQIANLKMKKAWETSLAPGKSIPMNAIMLYMSGNSIQIFSVMVTVMLLWNSVKAIMGTNTTFERFSTKATGTRPTGIQALISLATDPLVLPKLVYILMQCGCLALGVWKCGAMGLLPTATSDWLAFIEPKKVVDLAFGGAIESVF
ncbi:hypothetical protein PhCBS80983_g02195 [Powellomyces hirtus]|uniref:ER membrane protein complex subunit 4 n=1 Tax=Powellomyces hirtus TaxID=109895 RepID=A0A507E8V0_9FUNG|nr:hypothetical protein DFJ77DRAFT_524420 [Powellomyces hirtus]TPX59817.1 hypothetical protein PhCBS80983_g02195 [Powellomyces hirtus]